MSELSGQVMATCRLSGCLWGQRVSVPQWRDGGPWVVGHDGLLSNELFPGALPSSDFSLKCPSPVPP